MIEQEIQKKIKNRNDHFSNSFNKNLHKKSTVCFFPSNNTTLTIKYIYFVCSLFENKV